MCANRQPGKSELIKEQARILFWQKGYGQTSIRGIARACGFEPGNIYNYFHSKEHLLFEILEEDVHQFVDSVKHSEPSHAGDPVMRLRSLVHNSVNVILSRRLSLRVLFDTEMKHLSPKHCKIVVSLRGEYDRIVRSILSDGMVTGHFADIDVKLVGFHLASLIVRTRIWYSPQGRLSPYEIAESVFELVMNGIGTRQTTKPQNLANQANQSMVT